MTLALLVAACISSNTLVANSYFEDFEDGVADGWTDVHGDWDVLFGVYRGIGRSHPTSVFNVSHLPQTFTANYSVEAVMSSSTDPEDVSKMIVLRYLDANNFYFVNFRAGSRRDVVVEQVLSGVRSLVTPEFLYQIPKHAQADWKHVRADIIGSRLIAYFEGEVVCDIALPAIVIPAGTAGVNVFSSGGGDEELYTEWYSWALAEFSLGTSLLKLVGGAATGGLPQVAKEDNTYYRVSPDWSGARQMPNIDIEWTGHLALSPLAEATIRFESSVTSGFVEQKLAVWDWTDSQWDMFDTRFVSSIDTPLRFPLTDLGRYVNGSGDVKVRATYFGVGDGSRFDLRIDEINVHAVAQ